MDRSSQESSTQLALQVPLDVCGVIIDILASEERDPSLTSVKKCSLVSQSFLPLCRKHIFASIRIHHPFGYLVSHKGAYNGLKQFIQLIKQTPEVGNYIRHLEFPFEEEDNEGDDFSRSLQCLTRLESLTISQDYGPLDWRSIKWPVRNALLRLIHLPTFTTLSLRHISNFLVHDLVHSTNLRHLKVISTTFFEDSADAPLTAIILPAELVRIRELIVHPHTELSDFKQIANARRSDGLPVIDLTELTTISVKCSNMDDMDTLRTFLKQGEQLIKIDLTISSGLNFAGVSDTVAPHIRTLKIARFYISIPHDHDDPLGCIPSELAKMAGKTVLETLSITAHVGGRNNLSGAEWGMLDTVLTSSGWSALKAVFLKIHIFTRQHNDLIESSDQFKKVHFPRLSASKSVDFTFHFHDD